MSRGQSYRDPRSQPEHQFPELRRLGLYCAWTAVEPPSEAGERTTAAHLSLSVAEIERLRLGKQQSGTDVAQIVQLNNISTPHGNAIRYSSDRESVLSAAIYCLSKLKAPIGNAVAWTQIIEQNAHRFWPKVGNAPLSTEKIERLLREAVNLIKE
jgi:hypothetical protein